jgi:hypothetical protein
MNSIVMWLYTHRRMVTLKVAVACALVGAHFYPNSKLGLAVNLVWLLLF